VRKGAKMSSSLLLIVECSSNNNDGQDLRRNSFFRCAKLPSERLRNFFLIFRFLEKIVCCVDISGASV